MCLWGKYPSRFVRKAEKIQKIKVSYTRQIVTASVQQNNVTFSNLIYDQNLLFNKTSLMSIAYILVRSALNHFNNISHRIAETTRDLLFSADSDHLLEKLHSVMTLDMDAVQYSYRSYSHAHHHSWAKRHKVCDDTNTSLIQPDIQSLIYSNPECVYVFGDQIWEGKPLQLSDTNDQCWMTTSRRRLWCMHVCVQVIHSFQKLSS